MLTPSKAFDLVLPWLLLAIGTLIALSMIANRLLRPVQQLREGAAQIGAGLTVTSAPGKGTQISVETEVV